MTFYENLSFDAERALYGENDIYLRDCSFDGPADGESALKEAGKITIERCLFNLRYPLWHCKDVKIWNSEMTENCRAALWYTDDVEIVGGEYNGIKALRECNRIFISNVSVVSPEFGWFSSNIKVKDSRFKSEYFMLKARGIEFSSVEFSGKYSFQYTENCHFEKCNFDTKDAFWHAKNITVKDSIVKGEYLAWYSENITFENCTIIGTQPLCYCKGLKLINCKMIDCDLSFEKSSVEADIVGRVDSVKNPDDGYIIADDIGEIIYDTDKKLCEIKNRDEK